MKSVSFGQGCVGVWECKLCGSQWTLSHYKEELPQEGTDCSLALSWVIGGHCLSIRVICAVYGVPRRNICPWESVIIVPFLLYMSAWTQKGNSSKPHTANKKDWNPGCLALEVVLIIRIINFLTLWLDYKCQVPFFNLEKHQLRIDLIIAIIITITTTSTVTFPYCVSFLVLQRTTDWVA